MIGDIIYMNEQLLMMEKNFTQIQKQFEEITFLIDLKKLGII